MAVIGASKPFVSAIMHGMMNGGSSAFRFKDDPFLPGAARALVNRLYVAKHAVYDRYEELMKAERWGPDEIQRAVEWLSRKIAGIEAMNKSEGLEDIFHSMTSCHELS